jgi:hypothetical protein
LLTVRRAGGVETQDEGSMEKVTVVGVPILKLKNGGDYRSFGLNLDKVIDLLLITETGLFEIDPNEKVLWLIVEHMPRLQKLSGKGVRLLGDWSNSLVVQIFDYNDNEKKLIQVNL